MDLVILALSGVAAAAGIVIAVKVFADTPDRAENARLIARERELEARVAELSKTAARVDTLVAENATLRANLENLKASGEEKLRLLRDAESALKNEFQVLANRIFEEKGKAFAEQNRERLDGLLEPFRRQLMEFRKRVDEVNSEDTLRSASLVEQVKSLQSLSNRVSDDANNLATAIRGDAKRQGDWGEVIVERIMEASGLVRDREYEVQPSLVADDGTRLRPDFIVHLPEEKFVVVDSKVSLTAYDRYRRAEGAEEKTAALKAHLLSVRNHVDELSRKKDYRRPLGNKTLDFVVMCVPIEGAFQLAFEKDEKLLDDLAATRVVITGPSTLMITLKLIAQVWRREKENRNAERIALEAGKLYDKVIGVYEAVSDARGRMDGVSKAFETALGRLKDGRGSLLGRIDALRQLGAKTSRQIPADALDDLGRDAETDEV